MTKYVLAAIVMMAASSSLGQVDVVDLKPATDRTENRQGSVRTPQDQSQNSGSSQQVLQLYYQLQQLQQEVLQLRGMIEQQAHEIKQLKQQRLDDYIDLDRRLSNLSQRGTATGESTRDPADSEPPATAGAASSGELAAYRSAIDIVLKQQDYDKGLTALSGYLEKYPDGQYAANAEYWLGQIYLLKNQNEKARQWFERLLKEHPDHQKAPEAKFKLGKIYDLLGDREKARALLEEVAASGSGAAGLAREYLRQNFSSS